jgi:bacteriorhodopsin
MVPFCYIVYQLFVGLKEAQNSHPSATVNNQVKWACWATVISWCTYPIVYTFPMFAGSDGTGGLSSTAMVAVQMGYTASDIIAKCGVGFLVYKIGLAKSKDMNGEERNLTSPNHHDEIITVE